MLGLMQLPDVVLRVIVKQIPPRERGVLRFVCKYFAWVSKTTLVVVGGRSASLLEWAIRNGVDVKRPRTFTNLITSGNADVISKLCNGSRSRLVSHNLAWRLLSVSNYV